MHVAAIYVRKSTDQTAVADEQKSVTRQIDHARAYAARKGWRVADEHVYVDDGVSGAEFANRPGFVRLMNALKPRASFGVLILSEASRLGRELFETGYALKQLSKGGVKVYSYLDDKEIALDSALDKFVMSAANFASEIEREKARQRVSDTMARKARQGHVCGGRCFGYTNVVITGPDGKRSHVERQIHEAEAETVRQIFEWSANGDGFTRIAKRLNGEHAPTPRPMGGRPAGWTGTSVRAILLRPMYHGEPVYNTTKKRDQWGQQKTSDRPQSEWIRTSAPELRIVDEDTWIAVHARLTGVRKRLGTAGRHHARDIESKFLLSGFARCSLCGGSLCAIPKQKGEGRPVYGCSSYHKRGTTICGNGLKLPADVIDRAVLGKLATDVLRPGLERELVNGVLEAMRPDTCASEARVLRGELQQLDHELGNLTAAVATGGELTPLLAGIKTRQARRDEITATLATRQAFDGHRFERRDMEAVVRAQLRDWRALLTEEASHIERRQLLREVLAGPLTFTPEGRTYRFEGDARRDRLLAGIAGLTTFVVRPGGSFESCIYRFSGIAA
jgi:DNA invertase Pin-like site-specific DNA recombinase